MRGSQSVVIIIDHVLFQIPGRPSDGAIMGTEPDICKRTGMLHDMICQPPKSFPYFILPCFRWFQNLGEITMGAGRPPEIMQVHSSFSHSYIICLQVQISQPYL